MQVRYSCLVKEVNKVIKNFVRLIIAFFSKYSATYPAGFKKE